MKVQLKRVTRQNWQEALALKVNEQQSDFVPSVAVSLAKVYVKPDGDNVEYIPFAIYDQQEMVGFIMHAYVENTANVYWINGFMIDKKFQGKGYGRAALSEMVHWIHTKFAQCKEVRLSVYSDNEIACKLYKGFGFIPTGVMYGEEEVWFLPINESSFY